MGIAVAGVLSLAEQGALVAALGAVACAVVVGTIVDLRTRRRWEHRTQAAAETRFAADWPNERARMESEYASTVQAYQERATQAQSEWDAAEADRVAWATALTNGDLGAIEQTVFESLDELDFPFESDCTIAAEDASHVFVNLDAPEIEDVAPETRLKALKSGALKQVKRDAEERNAAYAQLVFGIVLAVAATVLSSAPTVQRVTIAAFTQRKRRGAASIEDQYVVETCIARDVFASLDFGQTSAVTALTCFQTRFDCTANLALKKISIPSWVVALQTALHG